jgi:hypothetical protein
MKLKRILKERTVKFDQVIKADKFVRNFLDLLVVNYLESYIPLMKFLHLKEL